MTTMNNNNLLKIFLATFAIATTNTIAGPLRDRIAERRAVQHDEETGVRETAVIPAGVQVIRDVGYGRDDEQRFDVYLPRNAQNAPVILIVHGGGWKRGDKAEKAVIENKVPHWTSRGFIFISTNYRLLPKADPIEQAGDVARALAFAQRNAASWGGDPSKFILMGHSAGAHLVALLTSSPDHALQLGALPWLGTVMLDGAGLNIPKMMGEPHFDLYDDAFGTDPAYWRRASPFHQLQANAYPMLAVCSTQRNDACEQAHEFAAKSKSLGVRTQVLEQDLSHREINLLLGEQSRYTDAVDTFIATLGPRVAR